MNQENTVYNQAGMHMSIAKEVLQRWQERLDPYLSKIKILGEIPLEPNEHADIEHAIRELVSQHGLTKATRLLECKYPAAFVTYLAFKAAFNDDRSFWKNVARAIGLETPQPFFHPAHHWGHTFLKIIEAHPNLRRFAGVSGLEYVTPIRLHGGIPAFSLPDFFQYILLPSVEKAPYDGMDDEAALRALLEHYTAQLFVDDVVRYFFLHAGQAAQKFFSKCRRMARLAQTNQPLPPPQELGLRPYVVQAFETLQERQSAPALRRRRPRLFFDPYAPAFRILLPAQPLNLEQASARYDARLLDPQSRAALAEPRRLRPRRQGTEWLLEEVEWLLKEPLPAVQTALFLQNPETPLLSYSLRILPPDGYPPLLAFRYQDGQQVRLSPSLPARELWLFYPADCELHFEGTARSLETLHPFAPPWQNWQAAAWDLSQARLVRLLREGQDVCAPVAVLRLLEPALNLSTLPAQVLPVEEKPLYAAAPHVILPLQNPSSAAEELQDWHLRLESRYAATPQGVWEVKANELPFVIENAHALISLVPWLGESPAGTYHLTISRRGRTVAELPFRVCAGLRVDGLQPYYLPTEQGAQPVTFTLHLPTNARLLAEDESEVAPHPGGFTVRIPAEASQADLRLELPAAPEPIRIPLRISAPRLRWALALQKGAALEWTYQPVSRSLPELLQADLAVFHPRLRVELPLPEGEKPLVELHLSAPKRETPLQTSSSRPLAGGRLDFDLAAFFDTLRAESNESVFEFQLELLDANRNLNLSLPLLRLTREVDIRVCHFEALPDGNWRLHWYEPHPLRHRRLRLWSCWQPWAEPAEIPLPDDAPPSDITDASSWWMYDLPPEVGLPPGEYRAQFVVVSPYEQSPLPPFPPEQTIQIQMNEPATRLLEIEKELANAPPARAFALHFEKLCIYQSQKREQQKQTEIQWCLNHWREASLLHLEALARWLGQYDARENQRAFLIYLFCDEALKRLEEERHPRQFVQRYLSQIVHARNIRPESARRVLKIAYEPQVILRALQFLFQSDEAESRRVFWEFLEEGRISESDAAALLKDAPDFARHLLKDTPVSPLRSRLLSELSRYMDLPEYLVKTGYYVLCDVGWGKLLEIRGAEHENLFDPAQERPTLVIELLHLPGQKAEIDLAARCLSLPGRRGINHCKCGRFAALGGEQTHALWQKHQNLCGHTQISFRPHSFEFKFSPYYQATPPENELDTRIGE